VIVLVEPRHDLPLVSVEVTLRASPAGDPDGLEGLTRTTAELMRRGAGGRSRAEIDAAFDALGASLDTEVSHDAVGYTVTCLSRNLDAVMALLGDLLARPHLDADEHDRLRRENLATLDELRDDDSSLCGRYFDRFALAPHPYGRTAVGTEDSIARTSREDTAAWTARHVTRARLLVGFAGDVDAARAEALAARTFGDLAPGDAPSDPLATPDPPSGERRTFLVDKPERAQSQILIGHSAPPAAHPDALPLRVAATVFGGTFTSRLMAEVRVKRGWSYGASFRLLKARAGHSFRLRVFPAAEQTPDTLALVLAMWDEIARDGATAAEVEFAKSYLHGSWAFDIATPAERLDRRTETIVLGLRQDWVARHRDEILRVTPAQVNDAIGRFWHPGSATVVVTCTAAAMRPRLEGLPLGRIEAVPFDSY
jgi:zinc protease